MYNIIAQSTKRYVVTEETPKRERLLLYYECMVEKVENQYGKDSEYAEHWRKQLELVKAGREW